jgi:hypothetical protein
MRQIKDIIDKQLKIAVAKDVTLIKRRDGRSIEKAEIANGCRIGKGRIAHPDPQSAVCFDNRVAPNTQSACNRSMRIGYTGSGAIKAQAVIAACDDIVANRTFAQWSKTVRAAIKQSVGSSPGIAKQK